MSYYGDIRRISRALHLSNSNLRIDHAMAVVSCAPLFSTVPYSCSTNSSTGALGFRELLNIILAWTQAHSSSISAAQPAPWSHSSKKLDTPAPVRYRRFSPTACQFGTVIRSAAGEHRRLTTQQYRRAQRQTLPQEAVGFDNTFTTHSFQQTFAFQTFAL